MPKHEERIRYLESVLSFTLDALESAATLGDFQKSLASLDSTERILGEMCSRLARVLDCEAMAVFLVDEESNDFFLARCEPEAWSALLNREVDRQVERGVFARALAQAGPVFALAATPECGGRDLLLHGVATSSRIRGMLAALPRGDRAAISDSSLHLGSLILKNTANCLESLELYRLVREANTKLERQVRDMERSTAMYRQLFDNSPLALVLMDRNGVVLETNPGYEQLFGYARREAVGRKNRDLIVPPDSASLFAEVLGKAGVVTTEADRLHKSGRSIPVSVLGYPVFVQGRVEAVYFSYRDISERKAYQEQLTHQAFHDPLTGLPNRALFLDRLERCIRRSRRHDDYRYAVLMIDLNRFKNINDSLGHLMGDMLLTEIAHRFTSCMRDMDTVARLGGDEFAVLMEEFRHPSEVVRVVQRLRNALAEPFLLDNHVVFTDASIGVVIRTRRYKTPEALLRDADLAMYRAKENGEEYRIFNKAMYHETMRAMTLENELRQALSRGELYLRFQPIVGVDTGGLHGFEALVRWLHPTRGEVLPGEFISVAEEAGLINALGEWVLAEACSWLGRRHDLNPTRPYGFMNVNLSALQLSQRSLPGFIQEVLRSSHLAAGQLNLEITESAMMQDLRGAREMLERLKAVGLGIVVDDFGTGYSSLAYLQSFPLDYLKIDRSFVSGRRSGQVNREIVAVILSLARNLGLKAVAEGVEQPGQFEVLKGLSCDLAQGFLFAAPLSAEQAAQYRGHALTQA